MLVGGDADRFTLDSFGAFIRLNPGEHRHRPHVLITRVDSRNGKLDPTWNGTGKMEVTGEPFVSVMFDDENGVIVTAQNHADMGVVLYRYFP